MRILRTLTLAVVTSMLSLPALAADVALVLTVENYRYQPSIRPDPNLRSIAQKLRRAGFEVIVNDRQDSKGLRAATNRFADRLRQGAGVDRAIVVASGHFTSALRAPWLLGDEARDIDSLDIGAFGVPLNGLTGLLARHQGQAVIVLGEYKQNLLLGRGVSAGTQGMSFPHGVSGFIAPANRMDKIVTSLMTPGLPLAEIAKTAGPGIQARGYLPRTAAFLPQGGQLVSPEGSYWDALRDLGTEEALQFYLRRHPNGLHASEARTALRNLRNNEVANWKRQETQLNLTRAQRRDVQRDLTLLGYNTRGIDGVFGNGTRQAIKAFQKDASLPVTGYLTQTSLTQLSNKAERKRQRDRVARERQDRKLWQEVDAQNTAAGYAEYLRLYPAGLFSNEARQRHAALSTNAHTAADQAAWDKAIAHDGMTGYQDYLSAYPQGLYVDAAKARLAEFKRIQNNRALVKKLRQEERNIAGNQISRVLVEQRLATLGQDPGVVDGVFDENTRRALRHFQRSRGLLVTGLVTQKTMLQLVGG